MIKLIRLSASGLNLLKERVDIDFFAEQRILSDKLGMVSNLFGRVYTNNVISLVGINASGKTTILKLIALCFDFINGKSLNSIAIMISLQIPRTYKSILLSMLKMMVCIILYQK